MSTVSTSMSQAVIDTDVSVAGTSWMCKMTNGDMDVDIVDTHMSKRLD